MQNKESFTRWLPLVGLTFAVFVFNTSEFMPIGLLTDIATDLNISEARAGLLISVYAWVVAIMSLPLMIMVSKMELKRLLLSIIALFVVSHVASAFAEGYYTLMLSRIGVACAHSIFWSIAPPLAVRTVPDGKRALGLSAIATGSSVAMVVGLPLGRVVGLYVGWRMAFMSIAIMALGTVICLLASGQLIGLFTSNPDTIAAGAKALRIICIGFVVSAVSTTSSGALEGLGKGVPSLVISLCRYVVFIMPLAAVLCGRLGPDGVWHAFWITEVLTALVAYPVYHRAAARH